VLRRYSPSCRLPRDYRTTEKTSGNRAQHAIGIELDRGLRSLCARITRYEECERPGVTGCTYEDYFGLVTARYPISNELDHDIGVYLVLSGFYISREVKLFAYLLIFGATFAEKNTYEFN